MTSTRLLRGHDPLEELRRLRAAVELMADVAGWAGVWSPKTYELRLAWFCYAAQAARDGLEVKDPRAWAKENEL